MRSAGHVSTREEKAFSLHTLFVLISLHKPCEKSLLYPLVKKLPTGLFGNRVNIDDTRGKIVIPQL